MWFIYAFVRIRLFYVADVAPPSRFTSVITFMMIQNIFLLLVDVDILRRRHKPQQTERHCIVPNYFQVEDPCGAGCVTYDLGSHSDPNPAFNVGTLDAQNLEKC